MHKKLLIIFVALLLVTGAAAQTYNSTFAGGNAAGSTLTLKSTTNPSPSGDSISFNVAGATKLQILSNGALVQAGAADPGTNNVHFAGQLTAAAISPDNSAVPNTGIYLPSAGVLGFSSGSVNTLSIDSFGHFIYSTSSTFKPTINTCAGGTVVTGSTDVRGAISLSSSVSSCSINFKNTWSATPLGCIATYSGATGAFAVVAAGLSTTTVNFQLASATASGSIYYYCFG